MTKEVYLERKINILKDKEQFTKYYQGVNTQGISYVSEDVSGNGLIHCSHVHDSIICRDMIEGRNLIFASGGPKTSKNFLDCIDVGVNCEHFYAMAGAGTNSFHLYCSTNINNSSNIYYCIGCDTCSYCLGCIGLKNKSFCILNKQYTKEERHQKANEIFSKMEQEGTLGDFFPGSMNPFYFNDTAAYLIDDSFTKEEVEAKGYLRRDEPIKVDIPAGMDIVKTSELHQYEGRTVGAGFITSTDAIMSTTNTNSSPHTNAPTRHINPSILTKVIQDESGNVYRIVKMEYDFLMKHGLPLPRLHRLERMKMNFRIA